MRKPVRAGVRAIALFEGAKGALVLVAGLGTLSLVPGDVQRIADQFVRLSRLDPASRYPRIFLDAAARVTDGYLWLLAFAAFVYSLIRGVGAYGLWKERRWAEWFALASTSLYLPIEVYYLSHRPTWIGFGVLTVNAAVVASMAYALCHREEQNRPRPSGETVGAPLAPPCPKPSLAPSRDPA